MAEAVLGFVIQNLATLTIEEISSSRSVWEQVQSIKSELEVIRPFLKNVDEKAAAEDIDQRERNEGLRNWVQQVVVAAYRIEDVLDEFTFSEAKLHGSTGLLGVLSKICHFLKKLKLRHKIAAEIKDIKSSVEEIDKQRKRFDLISVGGRSSNGMQNARPGSHGISSYYMEEDQIVGHESIREELIDWLVDGRTQRRVFALVGAGGLGKTTIAANVYKTPAARNCFDCYAWIEVRRESKREDVLKKLLRQFYHSRNENPHINIDAMDIRGLIDLLRKYLAEKCYMVVFDDVWQDDFWKYVELALLDNNEGNRIIITTRNRGVADFIPGSGDRIRVRVLEGLPPDEAWQLFSRKAFSDGVCPLHLKKLSDDILEKCEGLPLAIVAVGGLLSKKSKVVYEWQKLLDDLGLELERDIHLKDCNRVLCESFCDLPHHLKLCLLYFALFPAGYLVKRGRLIRLWIAEGFVQRQYNMKCTLEEVAEGYLTELIRRSLVQVSKISITKRARLVRVHNLMHEIILTKVKQFGFCQLLKEGDSSQQRSTRRITIHKSTNNAIKSINNSKVRSIFLFDIDESFYAFLSKLFDDANNKLMKILDFKDVPLEYDLPKEVGNIFNLRYLSLRNTKVKAIPKSIGKLFNLETLDLKHTLVRELPDEIKYLKKLRNLLVCHLDTCHLDQFNFAQGTRTKIQEGIGCLTDLQKLTFVETNSEVVQELSKLRQLRKLGVRVTSIKGKDLCAAISNMKHLKSLNLESMDRNEIIDIQSIASPPQYLELLYLVGNLRKLPNWISNHQNLVKIHLAWSGLTDDPMSVLHTLPNLLKLSIVEAYNGEQLHFKNGWFPKLLELILFDLKELKLLIVENGTLPLLQSLQIGPCPLLETPIGIMNLRNFNKLILVDMSRNFVSNVVSFNNSFKILVSHKVEGKYVTETSYNPPTPHSFQQASKNGKGKYITKKGSNPPSPQGLQQISKDGEKGKNFTENVYGPGDSHSINQQGHSTASKPKVVQEEDKKEVQSHPQLNVKLPKQVARMQEEVTDHKQEKKDRELSAEAKQAHNPPSLQGLQQISKNGKEGKYIRENIYGPGDWDYGDKHHSSRILKSKVVQEEEEKDVQSHQHQATKLS